MTVSEDIQELKQELVKAKKYVEFVEQKIAFRPKGGAGKWTAERIKAKKKENLIASDLKRIEAKDMFEETEAFLKDYEEQEKIAKEKERVLTLFKEYKEKPKIVFTPTEIQEKPDFSKIGDKIVEQNYEALKNAQIKYNSAKQKASKRSAVGTGQRAGNLQRAYNQLQEARFDVSHEPILIENKELRAEIEWRNTIIEELEAEIEEVQAIIDEHERNIALFEKHGLIKPKTL